MIALATISQIEADVIYDNLDLIYSSIKEGSLANTQLKGEKTI